MKINLYDILQTKSAVSTTQGDTVYNIINSSINKLKNNGSDEHLIIDFNNIIDLTTAFLNNSVSKLFLNIENQEYLINHLRFEGFTNKTHINLLKLSLSNALILSETTNHKK